MVYTDPTTLEFVLNENPLQSSKLNQATNDQFLALFPDGAATPSWTPTLEATGTNPTTSSVAGAQYRIAAIQFFWARFVIDTPGSGNYFVALPRASVNLTGSSSAGSGSHVGDWHAHDDSTGNTRGGSLQVTGADDVLFVIHDAGVDRVVTEAVPWVWASGDVITISGSYPIA